MRAGVLLRLPENGGALGQDRFLLTAIRRAWQVWYVHEYKPANEQNHGDDDLNFTRWLLPGNYTPGGGELDWSWDA